MKSFHIYLNDKCLFKDLNEEEFDIIWKRIYRSYWREELSYSEVGENPTYQLQEHSY